jgi:hypothetical protein
MHVRNLTRRRLKRDNIFVEFLPNHSGCIACHYNAKLDSATADFLHPLLRDITEHSRLAWLFNHWVEIEEVADDLFTLSNDWGSLPNYKKSKGVNARTRT